MKITGELANVRGHIEISWNAQCLHIIYTFALKIDTIQIYLNGSSTFYLRTVLYLFTSLFVINR